MKSDNELLHDFRRGDRAAFDRLIRRHHVTAVNFFHLLLGSEKLSEDLTARVFVHIFADNDEFKSESQFMLYLYRAAYATWSDYLRRDGTATHALPAPLHSESEVLPAPETQTRNVSDSAVIIRNVNILGLLERLPNELKLLLVLHEFCGLSYAEIARVVDISQDAVKRRMSESFKYLRVGVKTGTASSKDNADAENKTPPAPPTSGEGRSMGVRESGTSNQSIGKQPS
jgi:RNA polymerase sigma-70 factor, ECF subfamily